MSLRCLLARRCPSGRIEVELCCLVVKAAAWPGGGDSGISSFNTYIGEGVDDLSEGEEWSCARGRTVGVRPQQGGVLFKCK
jgi:hypothetical protein